MTSRQRYRRDTNGGQVTWIADDEGTHTMVEHLDHIEVVPIPTQGAYDHYQEET